MTRTLARSWGRALCVALLLAGCGDDEPLPDLPCDIRARACQRAVFEATAALREQGRARLPDIRVITRAQFAEETRSGSRAQRPSRRSQVVEGALRLIAFLPANTTVSGAADEASIAGVAAYYHKLDKAVTIIDDAAADPVSGTYTLAHEFVHVLQDQREGFDRLDEPALNSDARLAVDALVEGEAVVVSNLLRDQLAGRGPRDTTGFYDQLLAAFLEEIAASPAPFTHATLTLPYPVGGRPLASLYLQEGYDGIAERLDNHPLTYAGWVEGGAPDALPVRMQCGVADPPINHVVVVNDRFGGAGLLALYTRLGLSGPDAFQAARAWTNDAFTIYAPRDETQVSAVLAWRIGLRRAEDAAQLAMRIAGSRLPVEVVQTDNEVYVTAATDPAVLAAWGGRSACRAPKSAGAEDLPTAPLLPRPPIVHRHRHL